jgi:hypothetical protein
MYCRLMTSTLLLLGWEDEEDEFECCWRPLEGCSSAEAAGEEEEVGTTGVKETRAAAA